jgi:hypothetical protein
MRIITRQTLANNVAQKWKEQYYSEMTKKWIKSPYFGGSEIIYKKLLSLGKNPNPDNVDEVIGNGSWTKVHGCCECGKSDLPLVVEIGEELDYESSTTWICFDCLRMAYEMVKDIK